MTRVLCSISSSDNHVDPIALLITDIQSIFLRLQQDRLFTRTILEELRTLNHRPWFELANGNLDDRWLAKLVRTRGIKARSVRTAGTPGRGYLAADFGSVTRPAVVHVTDM